MAYVLMVLLMDGRELSGPVFESATGCHRYAQSVMALDPEVVATRCVPYDDHVPSNIG